MCHYLAHLHSAYGSLAKLCFRRDNVIEIHDQVMFGFYLGLPHCGTAQMWAENFTRENVRNSYTDDTNTFLKTKEPEFGDTNMF